MTKTLTHTFFSTTIAALAVAMVLFFGFLSVPQAKAATQEELQAMIAQLMAQIALLQSPSPVTPTAPANRFAIGESVDVVTVVNVRNAAGITGVLLGKQTAGQRGTVVEGPIRKDSHIWWKIDYLSGVDGWTAESWLVSNTSEGASAMQKGFHKIYKGVDTAVEPGRVDARIAKIEVPAANIDRYINSVTIFASADAHNKSKTPWTSLKGLSLMVNGMKFGPRDVNMVEKWTPVSGQADTYAINMFTGNVKIPAGRTYTADLLLNVSGDAKPGDSWSFGVPAQGVVVWSSLTGARKYGNVANDIVVIKITDGGLSPITLTAPNGGEKWEMGVTNTVTWKPYGYNPDFNPARDVTAYLETKNSDGTFRTLGKVQESGKASIHWPTGELNSLTSGGNYAPAGAGYYIRIVNNKTGATDRSDKPFTLVAKPVDLKVNGSDGPVAVARDEKVVISWNAAGVARCEIHNAYKDTSRTTQIGSVPLAGKIEGYLHSDPLWGPTLYCYRNDGSSVYDSVSRTTSIPTTASLKVLSPNGGETLDPAKSVSVKYAAKGISSLSVALYKNDMWKAWIVKDFKIESDSIMSADFIPNKILTGLGEGDNAGDVFKIYIAGRKSDGSGFADDKSDQSFKFGLSELVSYALADIKSVTAKNVDPIPTAVDDEYTLYRIVLNNGKVHEVKIGFMPVSYRDEQFRKTGYTGDIAKLMAMATVTTPAGKITAFTVTPSSPTTKQSVTFSWSAEGVSYCYLTDLVGDTASVNVAGLKSVGTHTLVPVFPTGITSKTYTLACQDENPSNVREVKAVVYVKLQSATPVVAAPGKNNFGCSRSVATKQATGTVACYGMWDYGEDFGGDVKMCGSYEGKTGCVIQTPVCESGAAKATAYMSNSTFTTAQLSTISARLKVTPEVAKAGIAGLWEYKCTAPMTAGAVLGASTDIYSEIGSTLSLISEILKGLK